jgi:hypothetical protein
VVTYDVDDGLAVLLYRHGEGRLETGYLILEDDECLVRPLALAAILSYQQDLDAFCVADGDGM